MADASLDAIATDPDLAMRLDRTTLFQLVLKAQAVMTVCALAMVGDDEQDEVLDATEAARRIGISPITLSHRAKQEPYSRFVVNTGSRRLRFSALAIREWQASQRGAR